MPCYHPVPMAYTTQMGPTKTGGFRLVSHKSPNAGKSVMVPCGRCIGCRLEKSRQWAGRIMAESQLHPENCFITLTYRDEELTYGGQEHGILVANHLQLFWKRLRKWCRKNLGPKHRLSYYACGEYGDKSNRPHYHACVFNFDFPDKKYFAYKDGNYLYTSAILDSLWGHGMCTVGALTFESAAYVARYCLKKRMGNTKDTYEQDGITPEFARMSRRPAIGKNWFKKYRSDMFPGDTFRIRDLPSKPPRYFMKMLRENDPALYKQVIDERAEYADKNRSESGKKRLLVRERVKKSQIQNLTRKLD